MADSNNIREAFNQVTFVKNAFDGLQMLITDERVSCIIGILNAHMDVQLSILDKEISLIQF